MDLSSYALSLLRSGDLTLYRGTDKGVASVLPVTAENGSLVYLNRLEREYALRDDLDAAWAARPIALQRPPDAGARGSRRRAARSIAQRSFGNNHLFADRDQAYGSNSTSP
jgi:hypothetical protein